MEEIILYREMVKRGKKKKVDEMIDELKERGINKIKILV